MITKQEHTLAKLNAFRTILQLARKHKAESLCQIAEDLYKQAIIMAKNTPEFELIILLESLFELASYYSFQGKENEAKPLWEEIKIRADGYLKADTYIYVQSIFNLSRLYEKQEDIKKAEELLKELLQTQELQFGDESLEICSVLKQLAALYCRQQKYSVAESIHLRILVLKEFHLGTCSVEINSTVDALIDIFQKLGKWRLAEYMLNRQKAILVALHGNNSLCVASCVFRLSQLQELHTRELNKAIENLQYAIDVYKERFGEQAGPVALLQRKLDQMLFAKLENQMVVDEISTFELPVPALTTV